MVQVRSCFKPRGWRALSTVRSVTGRCDAASLVGPLGFWQIGSVSETRDARRVPDEQATRAVSAETSEEAFERFRRRNMRMYYVTAAVAVALGTFSAPNPLGAVLVIPSLIMSLLLIRRSFGVSFDPDKFDRHMFYWACGVGLVTLVVTAYLQNNVAGSTGLAFTVGVGIASLPGRRKTVLFGVILAMGAISSIAFLGEGDTAWRTVAMLTVFGGVWTWAVIDVEEQYLLLRTVERAMEAEREASLLRERSRIAADLHDIQGHTLHVIKLKAAVAARVQQSDPARTAEELAAIQELVAESIDQGRRLVASAQRLSFAHELTNAIGLFEAAGIDVSVSGDETVDPEWEPEAALVLREATTNILRHARASRVEVVAGPCSIEVRNDGVVDEPRPLRGLATLGDRLRGAGGGFSAGTCDVTDATDAATGAPWFVVRAEA